MKIFYRIVGSGFGIGLVPWAPGTMAALLTVAGYAGYAQTSYFSEWHFLAVTVGLCLISVASGAKAREAFGVEDPPQFVMDEVAGMCVSLLNLSLWPVLANATCWWLAVISAFLLFRLFDIWKPGWIRRLERLPGGWGITMDDVVAGIFANLCMLPLLLAMQWLIELS